MPLIEKILWHLGWQRRPAAPPPDPFATAFADLSAADQAIIRAVTPYTMTSPERLATVIQTVKYVVNNRIPGAFVECGVWRGGSTMAAALTLMQLDAADRPLYLFDTFEGMSAPTPRDVSFDQQTADSLLQQDPRGSGIWCHADLDDVTRNLASTGYPASLLHFVPGQVEQTLPAAAPDLIGLLRLDTDWYESTRHELVHLFPRVTPFAPVIIDDYGHWLGARQAVDDYLATLDGPHFLHRIDYTGRVLIKYPR